jgi:hypothetical protein
MGMTLMMTLSQAKHYGDVWQIKELRLLLAIR